MINETYKYSELTSKVIKCAMIVHAALGNGFQEVIYQRALAIELETMALSFEREFSMKIHFRDKHIGDRRVDFLVDGKVSVELKALIILDSIHLAQAMNYLEAYNLEVGMLINFGAKSLEWKRLFNKKYKPGLQESV